ncbi:TRAP transporter large permease [Victivallis vadensis]|uniref:TRAP transporter large permease n=1 Tax=Victivallis vadensis TaxID=172901 RepID=A0A848B3F7_9BACT|nr:TRAP transporter large permease [Victivallis vadensis]NMD88129.1 TRAP transporter large permease [Victivallis vadensis]
MTEVAIVLVLVFVALLLSNVPIGVAIGTASLAAVFANGGMASSEMIVADRMVNGVSSFSLLAIPVFVLSGILMGRGGMARRLIDFANALVGRYPGGLSYVNTLTCMMFGSISGSATAAVSSVGGFMLPEMTRNGYDRDFSVAVTTAAATTGLIIPPSNIMIVYAVACGSVSIAAIFIAGVIPGIVMGLCIMTVCLIHAIRKGDKGGAKCSRRQVWTAFRRAFLSLFLMVVIIGGILGGIFTATEAAAVAVAYSLILAMAVYREVKWRDLPDILRQTGLTTAVVMLLIAVSSSMSWIMTIANIPQTISSALVAVSENRFVLLLIINLLLLAVGTFMDMTPAVLIFTPIFLPVARQLGMSDIQFGIMMIANLCIGLCTPPVGSCLFLGCGIGKTSIANVTKPMIPFFIAMIVAVLLITFIPALSMWLPGIAGLLK